MKFDYVIGNPPYQDETIGDQKTYAPPIYHLFMDETFKIAKKVELITPGRFLFNAGSTPKAWNKKMLNDPHFKTLFYESDSSQIFPNTDIMGGIVISYHDSDKQFEPIKEFVRFEPLKKVIAKVQNNDFHPITSIMLAPESYKFSDQLHSDLPNVESMLSKGHKYDLKTNVLSKLENIVFFETPQNEDDIEIFGLDKRKRAKRYIHHNYLKTPENFESYKIMLPQSNGSKPLGDDYSTPIIGEPFIAEPFTGHTQTFLTIGNFPNKKEAESLFKYLKTKFCRVLIGALKITQHNSKTIWKFVPVQDFTENSDIDWSKSIHEIDQQLYKKYGLNDEEIEFIETHVKEME